MSDRKSRFNPFRFNKKKNDLNWSDDKKKANLGDDTGDLGFPSFESIIPENSPLRKDSNSSSGFYNDDLDFSGSSGFYNDDLKSNQSNFDEDLDGVDEKYAKYIFSNDSNDSDLENPRDYKSHKKSNELIDLSHDEKTFKEDDNSNNGNLKERLLDLKKGLLNKNKSSKTLFGKVTFALIFLVLISSIFYFFVYQPFQNELNLERNSKLNEVNALYKGPLEINENAYALKDQINSAYDVEEIKSIDVMMSATKDWRMYHSSRIVSSKDDFSRVMMSYGEGKNIIMSVKDANDFVKGNDAKILSNVQFEKVNTVIVPISLSRLQATAGLISVGSVVDVYSLSDNDSDYSYGGEGISEEEGPSEDEEISNNLSSISSNETLNGTLEETEKDPIVSGATVLAILRSKDSGLVESTVTKSKTVIKGNETKPFENTVSYSSDVEELLKSSVLNSKSDNNVLDSYLMN